MARFALVKDGEVINFVAAEPGWEHPDGELVLASELTEDHAEAKGIRFARNGEDIKAAYQSKSTIALCGLLEWGVYQLLNNELPENSFIAPTSGTTGKPKLACISWKKIETRAQAFLDMYGSGFEGPVWFPNSFGITAFTSTAKMACILNDIPCFFGPTTPSEEVKIVAGTPGVVHKLLAEGKIPRNAVLMSSGSFVTDEVLSDFLAASDLVIDHLASSDSGAMIMNKYRNGHRDVESVIHPVWGPTISPDGMVEVSLEQAADRYLTQELPVRNGRFFTGDKVTDLGDGNVKFSGRGGE